MSKLLDQAFQIARTLPADTQDDIALIVMQLVSYEGTAVSMSADENAAVEKSKAAAARGEFTTDDAVRVVWAKHGL